MTALRRMTIGNLGGMAAAMALAFSAPVFAQDSDAPVDVTAAPPPSAETIGPAQLRDFNLRGTVTRPADQPVATPAQPTDTATAQPRNGEAVPSEAAARSSEPVRSSDSRQPSSPVGRNGTPTRVAAGGEPSVTPSAPLEVTINPAPQPDYGDAGLAPATEPGKGLLSWPWLAALIALIGGGAFIAWSRRKRDGRYGDPGRMAFAGLAPDVDQEAQPIPPARPRPDPVPGRTPLRGAPRPDPVPSPGAVPKPRPAGDGTIVSTSLKPKLSVEFQPDRVVITDQEVVLMFDVLIVNSGSAPARDVLVEAKLFTAHLGQDREIATFFENPAGVGDRMTSIAPLGRLSLKSMVKMPLDQVHAFEAAGRTLFVPLVGLNLLYRHGSSDGLAAASFLVGRGSEDDEKLAPFCTDVRPRIFRGLSSRPHSLGMQPA
jgi:hypothetical protein